ncbi:MAG: TetR/AcrR family transcriptional regulator [Candidatus Dormibacteria bacterium]
MVKGAEELLEERGVGGFTVAEVSRRVGVASIAPYAHFADRERLLAAVAVHGLHQLGAAILTLRRRFPDPSQRLAVMARAYVTFAGNQRPLFELLFVSVLDRSRHPEIEAAESPLTDAFLGGVQELEPGADANPEELAKALEATASGHALFLIDGGFGSGALAVRRAAEGAARATLALLAGRQLLAPAQSAPARTVGAVPGRRVGPSG